MNFNKKKGLNVGLCYFPIARKIVLTLSMMTLCLASTVTYSSDTSKLLDDFRTDIMEEIYRTHGTEIEMETLLTWCGLEGLSQEIALTGDNLKRAVYDSFIVAGTQNVKATEVARKMNDEHWRRFSSSIYNALEQYKLGLLQGILYAKVEKSSFCRKVESEAHREIQVISNN